MQRGSASQAVAAAQASGGIMGRSDHRVRPHCPVPFVWSWPAVPPLTYLERYAKLPFLKFLTCDDAREKPGFE
jgi:hypothetical protein